MNSFFIELGIVMVLTFVVSYIMNRIKQPLLVGYILTGILAGPLFFDILSSTEGYETFSHIGVALLLFIVGLHLNVRLIKEVGLISAITGIGQVLFTSLVGFIIGISLGFSLIPAFLIAICLTFSSTIIIVKLLSDKKDLHKLYGKISMGFLLVQDLIAVVLLMIVGSLLTVEVVSIKNILFQTLSFAFFSFIVAYFLAKYIVPAFLPFIVKSQELLFIFVITWCFSLAALFDFYGFSLEIGALIAGLTLASTPYQFEISAKVKPLRDFFIVMFFILLGSQMLPDLISHEALGEKIDYLQDNALELLLPAVVLSIFVLIGNPLIVLILMTRLGYSLKTSFLCGLTVAQIGEFSLILAILGQEAGLLGTNDVAMITFVVILTIAGSTYMLMHGDYLFKLAKPFLKIFERKEVHDKKVPAKDLTYDVLVIGYDRVGYPLIKSIDKSGKKYTIVDYNPSIVSELEEKGISYIYGDANDLELIEEFDLENIELLISTISDFSTNSLLLRELKKRNKQAHVILTSEDVEYALKLYEKGADYVIIPHHLGGNYASDLINKYKNNLDGLINEKITSVNELKERLEHERKKVSGHHKKQHT